MKSILKTAVKAAFVLLVVYFVFRQFNDNWSELVLYEWTFDLSWFLASVAAHLLTFVLFSRVWCILISGFGYSVPLKYGFKIGYITNLGRYIPGKLWPVFGMAYYAKKLGISEEVSVTSWIVALMFALPSSFLVIISGLVFFPQQLLSELSNSQLLILTLITGGTLLVSIILIVSPTKSLFFLNKFLKRMGRPCLNFNLSSTLALKVYFGYFLCWVLYGLSFWIFLKAVLPNPGIGVAQAITAFVLAYQVGYVAFFAPGGIGVRELILTAAISPYIGPIATGIAVAARLWNLIVEILAAVIALLIRIKRKPEANNNGPNQIRAENGLDEK